MFLLHPQKKTNYLSSTPQIHTHTLTYKDTHTRTHIHTPIHKHTQIYTYTQRSRNSIIKYDLKKKLNIFKTFLI